MKTEVVVEHVGEVQFIVKARSHTLVCDQPLENGGYDEGMTPPEFLLASLGTCDGYYAVQYLTARKLATEGLRIRTSAEKVKDPARMDNVHIEVQYPNHLDPRHCEGVVRAIHSCLIHNTLLHPPRIIVEVVTPVGV